MNLIEEIKKADEDFEFYPTTNEIIEAIFNDLKRKADDGRVNEDLKRYMAEMKADPAKLREVVQAKDTFAASIPVYTYDGGNIIEKLCEKPGWPNVTHDGDMMYENTYSTDKRKVVKWAKENAKCGIEWQQRRVEEIKADLAKMEALVKESQADLAKLEADYNEKLTQ